MKGKYAFILLLTVTLRSFSQVPSFTATLYDTAAINGYFFFSAHQHLFIMDKYGEVVYRSLDVAGNDCDFVLQPNGEMSYVNFAFDKFMIMDSTFSVVDSASCKKYHTDFHFFKVLPNGHTVFLGIDTVPMNLSKISFNGIYGPDSVKVLSGVIQELDTGKNIVFEWNAINHFNIEDVDSFNISMLFKSGNFDWTHFNSLDYDKDGNILLSSRSFNEITKISHKDGSVIWRMGGKQNQFKFKNCPEMFFAQRSICAVGKNRILFFDGGCNVVQHGARAMEFTINNKNKTADLNWSYTYDPSLCSYNWGNVQRLEDSETLVNLGVTYDNSIRFVIVDAKGKKLFKLEGATSHIFRVHYYPSLPWKLHRPEIKCITKPDAAYLDAGEGYSSYQWNTGDTTQLLKIEKTGNYSVFVSYGKNGFIHSEIFKVSNFAHPCRSTPLKNKK